MAAALKGAGEIGFTIISLTFSLIAVLIPLLFMGDIVGRLFREFAITGGSDFDLSGGVADPDTDDVRADAQPSRCVNRTASPVPRKNVRQDNRRLWSWTGESAESSVADLKRGTQHAAA